MTGSLFQPTITYSYKSGRCMYYLMKTAIGKDLPCLPFQKKNQSNWRRRLQLDYGGIINDILREQCTPSIQSKTVTRL
jgi:hypothetical protein